MDFEKVNINKWVRKEHYSHFTQAVPCTFSITTQIDITHLINKKYQLYPALLYLVCKTCNALPEFRMSVNSNKELIQYKVVQPSYTIFHKENNTFSSIWSEYSENIETFIETYQKDMNTYGKTFGIEGKPNTPENCVNISMLPWVHFDSFTLNIKNETEYFLPIFTFGKYKIKEKRYYIPLNIHVNHAVCDGFHISQFIQQLEAFFLSL